MRLRWITAAAEKTPLRGQGRREVERVAKKILAVALTVLLLLVWGCGSNNTGVEAPVSYALESRGTRVDAFDKVTGQGECVEYGESGEGDMRELRAVYRGVQDIISAVDAYAAYLYGLGFTDYYDVTDARLAVVLRQGEGGVFVTLGYSGDELTVQMYWRARVPLQYGEGRYVSGDTMAFLPNPEVIIFYYPVLLGESEAVSASNQLILDSMSSAIAYSHSVAGDADIRLKSAYTVTEAAANRFAVDFDCELSIDGVAHTLAWGLVIDDPLGSPAAAQDEFAFDEERAVG